MTTFVKMYAPQDYQTQTGLLVRDLTSLRPIAVPVNEALNRIADGYVPIEVYKGALLLSDVPTDDNETKAILADLRVLASASIGQKISDLPMLPHTDLANQERSRAFIVGVVKTLDSIVSGDKAK